MRAPRLAEWAGVGPAGGGERDQEGSGGTVAGPHAENLYEWGSGQEVTGCTSSGKCGQAESQRQGSRAGFAHADHGGADTEEGVQADGDQEKPFAPASIRRCRGPGRL